jgi:hypothetical protein
MTRQRPWRAENPDAVIVARPSRWGNPYTIAMMQERLDELAKIGRGEGLAKRGARALAVEAFRCDLEYGPDSAWWWYGPHMGIIRIKGALQDGELAGKDLACWCPLDQPCHADVLLELANAEVGR